jgi:TP901 family phage tail tape measure protein
MAQQLTSSLFVKLIDGVTGPARGAAAAIRGIGSAMSAVNGAAARGIGAVTAGLERRLEANRAMMDRMRGGMIDAAAMGAGLYGALKTPSALAADFESVMLDIAQKADLSDAKMQELGKSIRALGPAINQTSADTAKGVDFLVGMGLDPAKALEMIQPIGKAATAYKAQIDDLSKAGFAAFDNLKVAPKDFARALDVMAQAGKEGAFEIKDMAKEFPSLTAAAQALGMSGVDGVAKLSAALQIARKGAGSSSEAANATANLMQKVISPETTKKFKEAGIDIRKELKAVQKTGGDVFEMIAKQVQKATKGDVSLVGDFFQDAEVQKFLRPLIANLEEYRRIRDKAAGSKGVVDADFARRMKTGEALAKQFTARMQELGITIGNTIGPHINDLLGRIGQFATQVAALAEQFPNFTKAVIFGAAALIGLKVAAMAAAFAFGFFRGAILGSALLAMRGIGAAALALINPLRLVAGAALVLRSALMFTGVGAIIAAIAMGGTFIYNNWKGVGIAFEAFKGAFMRAIEPVLPALQPVGSAITWLWEKVTALVGPIDEGGAAWARFGIEAGKAVGGAVLAITQFVQAAGEFASSIASKIAEGATALGQTAVAWQVAGAQAIQSFLDGLQQRWTAVTTFLSMAPGMAAAALSMAATALHSAGVAMIQSLLDGMKAKFNELIEWVKGIPGRILGAIGSIDLSGIIKMPSFGGGGGGVAGKRAAGGPVSSGKTYLVGEKGPELFTAEQSGRIIPNSSIGSAGREASAGGRAAGPITVTMGNIVVQGVQDAQALAEQVGEKLEAKLRELTRGLQADLGYTS